MENIVDTLFEFKGIIKIITFSLLGIGCVYLVKSIMLVEKEKFRPAVLLMAIGIIGLLFSGYSEQIVKNRGKVSLFEIQNKFVGKKVNVSGGTKTVKSIKYNEVNKIEVQYTDGTKSDTFKHEITDPFYILLIFLPLIAILSAVLDKLVSS